MDNIYKIIEFEQWCPKCKHVEVDEYSEPCFSCIAEPVNVESKKPVKFEEKDDK